MRVGLNDPHAKSIVLSETQFTADELANATPETVPPPTVKRDKKKRKVNKRS